MSVSPNIGVWLRLFVLPLFALAQLTPWAPAAAQSDPAENLAVILILDDSGSMRTNDATDLRYTAAQLFVALLDQGDAVGALRFSTTSTSITNGIEVIASAADQARLVGSLVAVAPDGFTDVKAAFEDAQRMRNAFGQAGYRVVVVFLTDGKPEVAQPYDAYESDALHAARAIGAPIMSIALTGAGQTPFLNQVSAQTGGRVIVAHEAADLLDSYLQILGDLKDRTVIGAGSSSAPGVASLPLDSALIPYIERVSFVVSKPAAVTTSLISPDGEIISATDPRIEFAVQDPRFSVVTLGQPAGGDWNFQLSGSGPVQARAILYSRLRVNIVAPAGAFEAGAPLPLVVKLVEEQPGQAPVTIIGQASFSALITRPDGAQDSLDQFYDDGTNGDAVAGDGLFTRLYVNTGEPGAYQIQIQGFKGAVPVSYQAQAQAIDFPELVVVQPAGTRYDIRDNSVPLELHLAGVEQPELDAGHFIAMVTTPGGETVPVELQRNGAIFSGDYKPAADGDYRVSFEPVEAAYLGLPFRHSIQAAFSARVIPALTLQGARLGLESQSGVMTPRFEVEQAQLGIPLQITITSTSPRPERVAVRLSDMLGFTLVPPDDFVVGARSSATFNLSLQSTATLEPGEYRGRLTLTPPDGVDLIDGEAPLAFELFVPTLSVRASVISSVSAQSCLRWAPVRLALDLTSNSAQPEQMRLRLDGLAGASLSEVVVMVAPGNSQAEVVIQPAGGAFDPGEYAGRLIVETARPGVQLQSADEVSLAFAVDPLWVNCRRPLGYSGLGLLVGLALLAAGIRRQRRRLTPPNVTGDLAYWREDDPDKRTSVDLTELRQRAIRIGRGSQNHVIITDDQVQDEHAVILVDRDADGVLLFTLRPLAPMFQGYREFNSERTLEAGVEYRLGNTFILFTRDDVV